MIYDVKWLPEAEMTYALVLEYLDEKWTKKEIVKFINRTNEVIRLLAKNPKLYTYSKKKDAYKVVLTKHTSLFYRLKSKEIELLVFWDTRQNPDKLKL